MKVLLIILGVFLLSNINAQSTPVSFEDCKPSEFTIESDKKPKWNNDKQSIVDYLNIQIQNSEGVRKVKGKVYLGIIVFDDGSTCCHSFTNMTNKEVDPDLFKDIVNNMPNWLPGQLQDKPTTYLHSIIVYFKKGRVIKVL